MTGNEAVTRTPKWRIYFRQKPFLIPKLQYLPQKYTLYFLSHRMFKMEDFDTEEFEDTQSC